ncbi:MAG: undecaprenyl-phosphate glucose phosphotransferase [Cryomorphaceae bacterium]|nr:undecaprenyl-phosphate glucose phosphotransferase [Flavobacteriales bacterium]
MKFRLSNYEKLIYLVIDLVMLNLAFAIGFFFRFSTFGNLLRSDYLTLFLFINFMWLLGAKIGDYSLDNRRRKTIAIYWDFVKAIFFNLLLTLAFISLIQGKYSETFVLRFYLLFFVLGGLSRILFNSYLKMYRKRGYNFRRMVVVGVNPFSIDFVNELIQHPEYGYKFLGFFGYNSKVAEENIRVRKFDKIHKFLLEYEIDEVYIALPSDPDYHIKELIKFCHLNYIKINFLNEFIHLLNKKTIQVNMDYNGPTPIVSVAKEPLEVSANKVMKRTFDLVFSLFVVVFILSWLVPVVALLIKLSSRGPVFFKQKRTGLDGHTFYCYKFRTMRVNAVADEQQATEGDGRITKVGKFLRRFNIDEFPQFVNVLKGDMSVVGPRPHMLSHTRIYSKLISPFMVRHWVKPGITGLAQAKGYRGETTEVRQMYQRVRMDVFYIQNWSFTFDIKIVLMTIWNMITIQKTGV